MGTANDSHALLMVRPLSRTTVLQLDMRFNEYDASLVLDALKGIPEKTPGTFVHAIDVCTASLVKQ